MKKHLNELTEGMQRLCAVANRVVQQQGSVERIELDLMMEELRRLYGVVLQMGGEGQSQPMAAEVPSKRLDEPSPVEMHDDEPEPKAEEKMMAMMSTLAAMQPEGHTPEPAPTEEVSEKPEPVASEPVEQPRMEDLEQNDNALLFDEVIMEPEPVASEPEPEVSMPEPEPAVKPSQQASLMDFLNQPVATVGEQPNNTQRTLGESLGADRPQPTNLEKKVDDLRSVININDKFCFMSELFHNNMKAYNDFIMSLNAIADRDEALAYVQEAATQQKWDDASSTVKAFYKIFDKKF